MTSSKNAECSERAPSIISLLKLTNNQEIIGEVLTEGEDYILLSNPLVLFEVVSEDKMSFGFSLLNRYQILQEVRIPIDKVLILPVVIKSDVVVKSYKQHLLTYNEQLNKLYEVVKSNTDEMMYEYQIKQSSNLGDYLLMKLGNQTRH